MRTLYTAAIIAVLVTWTSASFAAQTRGPEAISEVAAASISAVVNISTTQAGEAAPPRGPRSDVPDDGPFSELFEDLFDEDAPLPRNVASLGSGFVISAQGHIVTNNHVIEGAETILVNFTDGAEREARLVGADPKTDLALLQVEVDEDDALDFVAFGPSDGLEIGQWVLAIGNPFGLGSTVTAGIVSATNRDINAGPYDDFIQTDAAINKGNSGGPLFDMSGRVIGINTAIISPFGGSVGISFAVPSSTAVRVIDQLREFGRTRRGWLGVRVQDVSDEIAEGLGLDRARGALITTVTPGAPAALGGVERGDVILSFDGRRVNAMRELPRIVASTPAETDVEVIVWRNEAEATLTVNVGLLDEDESEETSEAPAIEAAPAPFSVLGLTLETAEGGVRITRVEPESNAAMKALTPGTLIQEAGDTVVAIPEDVLDAVEIARGAGKRSILLLTLDEAGESRFVPLRIED